MRLSFIGLAAVMALAACNTPVSAPPVSNSAGPSATPTPAATACAVTATAMYAAEAAYNVAANAYVTADGTPALAERFAPVRLQAKGFLVSSYAALTKARVLYGVRDAAFCDAASSVVKSASEARRLVPK